VSRHGSASDRQLELPLGRPGDETVAGTEGDDAPVEGTDLRLRNDPPTESPEPPHT
jgi:hypothetical protein